MAAVLALADKLRGQKPPTRPLEVRVYRAWSPWGRLWWTALCITRAAASVCDWVVWFPVAVAAQSTVPRPRLRSHPVVTAMASS